MPARSAEVVERAIDRLNLDRILASVRKEEGWTAARARSAAAWYRNFLKLAYKSRRWPVTAISRDSDRLWHEHILDTRRYAADCKRIFGHFLDHRPLNRRPTKLDLENFEKSKALYVTKFGKEPPGVDRICDFLWRRPYRSSA